VSNLQTYREKLKELNDINAMADMRDILVPLSEEWFATEARLRELLQAKYKDEAVLVVDTAYVTSIIKPGYTTVSDDELVNDLSSVAFFMPRYKAEFNPAFKQLIPYIIAKQGDKIFTMTRIKGDSRLVGNISIGIGGHINPCDEDKGDIIMAGLYRELEEEVDISNKIESFELKGIIYDNSNKVGQDHVGLIFICNLDGSIEIKEKDTLSGELREISSLGEDTNVMENWTKIAYDNLLK
jgi:predicted NUDIX family phosphoesterase